MYFDLTEIRNDRMELDIAKVITFVEQKLFPTDPDCEVRFESCPDLGNIDGYCTQEDEGEYLIEVNMSLRGEDLIRTVIHELVHVQQYLEGKLSQIYDDGKGPRMYWQKVDMSDVLYEERPWECEAHSIEESLYLQYIQNGV